MADFFDEVQGAAVLKHGLLRRYVVPFASKTGSISPGGLVVVIDGYAGPGRYRTGDPGSPALLLAAAQRLASMNRELRCLFVEPNPEYVGALAEEVGVALEGGLNCEVLEGTIEQHLDDLIVAAAQSPLFLLLDPYGMGLPFADVVNRIMQARPGAITEVLLNLSCVAIRRIAGHLGAANPTKGQSTSLAVMDTCLGGAWWRETFVSAGGIDEHDSGVNAVVDEYFRRLTRACRCAGWLIPVRDQPSHKASYFLIHLTRHSPALTLLGDCISSATEEWRAFQFEAEHGHESEGLIETTEVFKSMESDLAKRYVSVIRENLNSLLGQYGSFLIESRYGDVMKGVLGEAREKHVRAAIKKMFTAGETAFDGKGTPLWKQTITPPN